MHQSFISSMVMAMKIEKQSSKLIKPFVQTPPTQSHYKLGFIDELAPAHDTGIVLFFAANSNHNPNFLARLEKSLGKTLTRLYPLAGRYVEETHSVDCKDQGAEFIHAKVNIKLQDFLVSEENVKFTDEFIPSKIGVARQQSDPLLATQVTTFECGGLAIGASATHKIVDASTLCTFVNEWAVTNREENEIEFKGPGFNSSILFPGRGLSSIPLPFINIEMLNKYTKKKLSFSGSAISKMKAKCSNRTSQRSKVQLVSAILWKTFMGVDLAIHNHQRHSIHIQAVSLREKMASSIPKTSCGNLCGACTTECTTLERTEELADRLTDSVKKTVTKYSKERHDCKEGQAMVLNLIMSSMDNISESTNVVFTTSWCKFPFYEADFGFGKPTWVAPGIVPVHQMTYMIDDAEGTGVEAYVYLEVKDVPYFEEALEHAIAFGA
ncbi:putative transferase [Helianthus annuus]|nr:putative transferase [Helianthus annuus]